MDDSLLAEAKKRAADTGRTLTAVIEDALRVALSKRPPKKPRSKPRFPTYRGKGVRPGVDLDNSADLLDLMEGRR